MLRVFVKRPDDEAAQNEDVEELVKKRATGNAFGRTAKPEEIASAALFLISDEASFITVHCCDRELMNRLAGGGSGPRHRWHGI